MGLKDRGPLPSARFTENLRLKYFLKKSLKNQSFTGILPSWPPGKQGLTLGTPLSCTKDQRLAAVEWVNFNDRMIN
jgi:hypothetical protein